MLSRSETLRHKPLKWLRPAGLIGLGLACVIVVVGLVGRGLGAQHLKTQTLADAVPTVDVVSPSADRQTEGLTLPGDVQADTDAVIHSRVSGYLKRWYVDIGAAVKAGQLLAEIDTPDLDQQLEQAKANLATASANQRLAQVTAARWQALLGRDAVSRQEADEKAGDLEAKTAVAQASKAELSRLQALESFKRIVAPFAGVVTARNTDIGALIAAGNPTDPGLFTVADVHRMRIYVRVPQSDSAQIKPGSLAKLSLPEYPGRVFQAKLVSTSGAVAAQSGTVLFELQADNADHSLKPGAYAQVRFTVPPSDGAIRLPATALMFRKEGMIVGVIGPDDRVQLRVIKIKQDLGSVVEVLGGLTPKDRVIDNPPDSLTNGEQVRTANAPAAEPQQ